MERLLGHKVSLPSDIAAPRDLHLVGQWAELRPLNAGNDAAALYDVMSGHDWIWDYLFEAPPSNFDAFAQMLSNLEATDDKFAYVIRAKGDPQPLGYSCFWTTNLAMGSNEIGNVNLSPTLQHTPVATDAFYLMNDWAFSNGYRRMEWKCNALNAPSRRAAQRLGFSYEGVFRNHMIVKGLNRDTAWFAMTNADWHQLRTAYQTWLGPENFDAEGRQKKALSKLTTPFLVQSDPAAR